MHTAEAPPSQPLQPTGLSDRTFDQEERKNVTILFVDIVGSTAMVAARDPEVALEILRPALSVLSEAVERYGGTVTRDTGDGLMAIFGAPFTNEEHALGGCCAALEMHSALVRSGFDIQLRVGLHSGEVVVHRLRSGAMQTLDAAGEAVHLAARLQQGAPPGSTWISDATFALARGRLETRIVGPQTLRGFATPAVVHLLQAADASLSRLDVVGRRGLSPFIDRAEPLALLQAAYSRAAAGKGCASAIAGEPGVGKSRLIREFVAARGGVRVLEARCTPWRDDSGFHVIRALTRRHFGVGPTDDPATMHARLESAFSEPGAPSAAAFAAIAALHGALPSPDWNALAPSARRRRIIEACLAVLTQAAVDKPLLIVIDDLHWADPDTDEIIGRLLGELEHLRLLLLLGWRAGFQPSWADHPAVTLVGLSPLSPPDARHLARTVLGQLSENDAIVATLAERAGGNPFFIEEAAAMPEPEQVPPTVRGMLGARIDRLQPDEKQFIEVLSAIGEPTSAELVSVVLGAEWKMERTQAVAAELERTGLLRIDGAGASARLACRHSLLQEVAYSGLTRARRRAVHGRIAAAMERLSGDQVTGEVEVLARHARLGEDWKAALRHARAAGARAASHSGNRAAVRFYEEALEALSHRPEDAETLSLAMDLRFALREPLFHLGRIDLLRMRLGEAATLAERVGDVERLGQLYRFQSHHAWLAGDYRATIAAAERAAVLAASCNDPSLKLRAVFERALGEFGQGNFAAAAAGMAQVAEQAEDSVHRGRFGLDDRLVPVALGYQCRALADLGQFDAAQRAAETCAARAASLPRPFESIFAEVAWGYLLLARGAASQAVARLAKAMILCDRAEADLMRPVVLSFLGAAQVASGSVPAGLQHLELAVSSAAHMGFCFQQPLRLAMLAEALIAAGRTDEGAQRAAEAVAMAKSQGDQFSLSVARRVGARAGAAPPQ